MIVLMFGPPGSGKGTQSALLVEACNLQLISVGDLLRSIISSTSELGKKIKGAVESGKLIRDDIICELLRQQLALVSSNNILLDGFPRNLNQARFLSKVLMERYGKDVDFVIELQIGDEIAIDRLKNRYICFECKSVYNVSSFRGDSCVKCKSKRLGRRTDDSDILVIKERMSEYHFQMKSLREYYKDRLLLVDAVYNINEVSQEISNQISRNLV